MIAISESLLLKQQSDNFGIKIYLQDDFFTTTQDSHERDPVVACRFLSHFFSSAAIQLTLFIPTSHHAIMTKFTRSFLWIVGSFFLLLVDQDAKVTAQPAPTSTPTQAPTVCEDGKCIGTKACETMNPDLVGCGSCMGKRACWNGSRSIGSGSCLDDLACAQTRAVSSIGDNSCLDPYSCGKRYCNYLVH